MTPVRESLAAWAEEREVELAFYDPPEVFDPAIVGVARGCGQDAFVVYDEALVLQGLQARGMSEEDAAEWYSFNTLGAYVGPGTPMFIVWRRP